MLPGFRLLVASVLLAASLLIFGIGAGSLFRATREEFSEPPMLRTTLRTPPSTLIAEAPPLPPQPLPGPPTLAILQVIQTPATEPVPTPETTDSASDTPPEPEKKIAVSANAPTETPAVAETATIAPVPPSQKPPPEPAAAMASLTPAATAKPGIEVKPVVVSPPARKHVVRHKPRRHKKVHARWKAAILHRRIVRQKLPPPQPPEQAFFFPFFGETTPPPADPATPVVNTAPAPALVPARKPVHQKRSEVQGLPVATGGPSGNPHSAHDPS